MSELKDLKRYRVITSPLPISDWGLHERGDGEFVKFSDVEALVAPAKDAEVEKRAILAVKDIVSDMCNGSGGDRWYESCDRGIRREIRDAWEAIIIRRITDSKEVDSE